MKTLLASVAALALSAGAFAQDDLRSAVESDWSANLESLYEHFHANPELSLMETETAARLAEEIRALGYEVTEGVGGTGIVAVMENGEGPTLMLRADMDGLPIEENTGLDYASTVMGTDRRGLESHVMHACAHDTHMTGLVGTARQLAERRDEWSGTLVLIGQPAEELGLGAMMMLDDGLYERFPLPDAVVAFHTFGAIPAGMIGYVPGYAMANVDSVDITVRGIGAHGSTPHVGRDPVLLASQIVVALQTLVSRELNPQETGVVTVGAINGGTKHNIIPDEVHLQITVRSYTDANREMLLSGIERIAHGQAASAGIPEELWPTVEVEEPYTPATYNDPDLTARGVAVLQERFGQLAVRQLDPVTGGEDFSRFGRTEEDIPIFMFWVGGTPEDTLVDYQSRGLSAPGNHSALFAPDAETAIVQATEGLTAIALDFLQPDGAQ
ncbi:amidohydrolase [Hyphobacterium sp. HN65]|uniref:Amidohydrolase n=1 Tax=Hyphobacterium lacteum TaxID=3116575 RepID=A0ABU7LV45_9PROT|nr:amidohydrolase [Hyphobacterium sp. HN65]MEE2527204.1 amidohydrolase [Hyphobacterium sp. HN65]